MDWYELVEHDHGLQNPTSAEKVELVGEYLRLGPDSRVLDVACGKCGPALILAQKFGCRVHGIELRAGFVEEARRRIAEAGLTDLVDVQQADASRALIEPEAWDAALCLGAAFVWGHIGDAASILLTAVRPGGGIAIGEPFAMPGYDDPQFVDLQATVARFIDAGAVLTGMVAASTDDWDRYESLHWRAAEEYLAEHDDPEIAERQRAYREDHMTRRFRLGWAMFVGRKP
jgi:SAM-dependent methyltransferase